VTMAKMCRHVATPVTGRAVPVMTSCVASPAPAGGDNVAPFVVGEGTPAPHHPTTHEWSSSYSHVFSACTKR
jgi:hypothetical protein